MEFSCVRLFFNLYWVKQGGVILPVMFNLYLDNLLISLKQSGIGCHINGTYMGALGYAYDITLTCPRFNQSISIMSS